MLILTSLLLLLVSVSAAHVQSAWVLWKHRFLWAYPSRDVEMSTRWDRFETFRSEAECRTVALKLATTLH